MKKQKKAGEGPMYPCPCPCRWCCWLVVTLPVIPIAATTPLSLSLPWPPPSLLLVLLVLLLVLLMVLLLLLPPLMPPLVLLCCCCCWCCCTYTCTFSCWSSGVFWGDGGRRWDSPDEVVVALGLCICKHEAGEEVGG